MALRDALRASLEDIPDGIAVGLIDLSTGTLISHYSQTELPQEFLNVATSAVSELIEAPIIRALNRIWESDPGDQDIAEEGFSELLLFGNKYTILIKRFENLDHVAGIYVVRKETPPGVILMHVRANASELKKHTA